MQSLPVKSIAHASAFRMAELQSALTSFANAARAKRQEEIAVNPLMAKLVSKLTFRRGQDVQRRFADWFRENWYVQRVPKGGTVEI